ncbi:restriction endonuclease subunit S domain-containing protein [Labilibaculum euxinus]
MLICPSEIKFTDILERKSLSPNNYSEINIINPNKDVLLNFLDSKKPFDNGEEPGSFTYVPNSNVSFVRNSCIDSSNFSNQVNKEIFLNPKYDFSNQLVNEDVLLCKDANIGDTCLFIHEGEKEYVLSSGVVKLNFKTDSIKYYCLAFLRDEYFLKQLEAKTPIGSTIRHAGTKFLECLLPKLGAQEEKLLPLIEALFKNITYSERVSYQKLCSANKAIENDFFLSENEPKSPNITYLMESTRLDAGFYSQIVYDINYSINNYKNGTWSLQDAGFSMKRGTNLQKRDLGRSIKSEFYKKNYHLLVYPSDISDNGYILKEVYIGARNPVWYMKEGDILFSAEGTVGKVFVICDETMKFVTNIHGLIISPNPDKELKDSIILGQYLHFLRSKGYFDKVSVGGQGGSYAVNYWEDFKIPKFGEKIKTEISKLYHSGAEMKVESFSINNLEKAGVFELNKFRIKCNETLKLIVQDIKNNKTKTPEFYIDAVG